MQKYCPYDKIALILSVFKHPILLIYLFKFRIQSFVCFASVATVLVIHNICEYSKKC